MARASRCPFTPARDGFTERADEGPGQGSGAHAFRPCVCNFLGPLPFCPPFSGLPTRVANSHSSPTSQSRGVIAPERAGSSGEARLGCIFAIVGIRCRPVLISLRIEGCRSLKSDRHPCSSGSCVVHSIILL